MKKLNYAITGANGQIGSFLVDYLRDRGHVVYELVRSPEKSKDNKYYKFFDLSRPDKMPSLDEIDVLIHAAFLLDTTNKQYEIVNVEGTLKLFEQANQDKVRQLIFISTISAHSEAFSLYGKTKYKLEKLLKNERKDVIIIRPGLVFHNTLKGITAAMDNFVRKFPVVPLIGRGAQLIYPCLLEELAHLIFMLSLHSTVNSPIVAASEKSITFKQLIKYLGKRRNKSLLLIPIPFYIIYVLLKTLEFFGLSIGLRSDSLLGIQYQKKNIDFTETKKLEIEFNTIKM